MTLTHILVFGAIAAFLGLLLRNRWRVYLLLGVSALAVYALQPTLPVRYLDFWLPTGTLTLAVFGWILTTPREQRDWRANWPTAIILTAIVLALGLTRYLGFSLPLTASRPPQAVQVLAVLVLLALPGFLFGRFAKPGKILLAVSLVIITGVFVVLKVPALAAWVSSGLRSLNHQSTELASALDLRWLGFSYIAFRLLHTIRDRQTGP